MALLHKAQLQPTKLELLADWLPAQPWMPASADDQRPTAPLERVAAFRFDDPDGEVGIETLLVQSGDAAVVQVPLTYRAAPLADAEQWLVGTMNHSVLGQRWVYDACGDPVYVAALATAILTGGTEAAQYYEVDGRRAPVPSTAHVNGSGSGTADVRIDPIRTLEVENERESTVVHADSITLTILRRPTATADPATDQEPVDPPVEQLAIAGTLIATWDGHPAPVVLATAGR